MNRKAWLLLPFLVVTSLSGQTAKRRVTLDDLSRLREVSEPRISPEGTWVAYSVRSTDTESDKRQNDLYMSRLDGSATVRLTSTTKESETSPRWSPDGRYLAFLSSREDEKEVSQLWLLDRQGGEAQKISESKGSINDLVWSPDSKSIAFAADDPDPDAEDPSTPEKTKKTPKPIVIDRFYFKEDRTGYLGVTRQHLYLLDVATHKSTILTPGMFNESLPSWSPDGKSLAFISKRSDDFDRTNNFDLFVIDAVAGAKPRALTTYPGDDNDPEWESRPDWSPDGKWIAYLQGGPQELIYYANHNLAVISASGGTARLVSPNLDRTAGSPRWSADGRQLYFVLEDDRGQQLARVRAEGGAIERLTEHAAVVEQFDLSPDGHLAYLKDTVSAPAEIYSWNGQSSRQLTFQNKALLDELQLASVQELDFKSKDGTVIGGMLTLPPDFKPGTRLPALLRIHGGPVSQFANQFSFEWQLFAANGYAVIAANPRGSSGRGEAFSRAIYADWGNKDTQDVLAAVDAVVARGIADPNHLGVGGWSYGGILTNYVIASDSRFKAATSGASISNVLAGFGTDMYVREYEAELGLPWQKPETWMRLSYPFLHADRIKTPTLFLCGSKDFNVPLLNSEQMYQALRSLGVPTQLIIYPDQFHGLTRPSYLRDRLERYLAWYGKYVK